MDKKHSYEADVETSACFMFALFDKSFRLCLFDSVSGLPTNGNSGIAHTYAQQHHRSACFADEC